MRVISAMTGNPPLDHEINSTVPVDCCFQIVIWSNGLVILS